MNYRSLFFQLLILFNLFIGVNSYSQTIFNPTPIKTLINEYESIYSQNDSLSKSQFKLKYILSYYNNTNLPNLENQNGFYFPKGHGNISSLLFHYKFFSHLTLSIQPTLVSQNKYNILIPNKEKEFSVLNDVPLEKKYANQRFRNAGLKINFLGISTGYGNWNMWWGPGIHNSLSLSNNSEGFYHYFIELDKLGLPNKSLKINMKYLVSAPIENLQKNKFYLSAWFLKMKFKIFEFGINQNITSGGNYDLTWDQKDALFVPFNRKNIKHWDTITSYYLLGFFEDLGLKIFFEIGYPNRSFGGENPKIYSDHAMGSNLGFRKYGLFNNENLIIGLEYTRLIQGLYYNILPTPNWYDNKKYNYSSYKGRRWAAHSGSDSDDLLLFFGYIGANSSFIYGLNYERHGVNFRFPPEVKFESRITFSYMYKKIRLFVNYENEYFEHYGFVDSNNNIWEETFEPGSIQRTNTILFTVEYILSL